MFLHLVLQPFVLQTTSFFRLMLLCVIVVTVLILQLLLLFLLEFVFRQKQPKILETFKTS